MIARRGLLLGAALIAAGGCAVAGAAPDEPVVFPTGAVELISATNTVRIQVEIAATGAERRVGLSGRSAIPENDGMIFLFEEEQPGGNGFWMYRTRIPLSIAFLDGEGTIVAIMEMEPCSRRISLFCPRYRPRVPFSAALEVPRRFLERHDISVGDKVVLHRQ